MKTSKKTNICVSVDVDTLLIAKTKVDNISSYVNECLAGLSGRTDEDRTKEQLSAEIVDLKGKIQDMNIRLLLAQESIKKIDEAKLLKAKESLENEQFKRWICRNCKALNFMESDRCAQCALPTRKDPRTKYTMINEANAE